MAMKIERMNGFRLAMSEAKHLKGPWRIGERETLEDGSIYPRHIATEDGGYQICLLESTGMAALGYERTPSEQERDRLIAAAPDLLEALEGAYALAIGHAAAYQFDHQLDELHPTHAAILEKARAAIAKAVQS